MRIDITPQVLMGINVLVLDDDELLVQNLKYHIEKNGFNCTTSVNPDECLKIIEEQKIDILVIDYLMVGISAVQIIEKIREFNSDIYIILLTGFVDLMPSTIALQKYDIDSYCEKSAKTYDDVVLKINIAVKSLIKYRYFRVNSNDGKGFGERLKYLRTKNRLRQDDVANFLGVGRTTIANYESGVNEPTMKHLRKIAEYFDVSYDYLLNT